MRFHVPIPPDTPYQKVEALDWGTTPTEFVSDKFEQQVALFTGITIQPSGHHVLEYRARVKASAVQYRLDDVPLAELDQIPAAIRGMYLGHDAHFDMDTPAAQQAAEQARKVSQGNAPSGVRSLIENIVAHVTQRLTYVMDDTWDPAGQGPRTRHGILLGIFPDNRLYQGGKRERKTYVVVEPSVGNDNSPIVTLR